MMTEQNKRYQKAMSQGHSAAWDQDWGKAAEFYRAALVESTNDIKALNSLALALFEMQAFDEALKTYLHAGKLAPNDPLPYEKAATIYAIQEDLGRAADTAVRAAEVYLKRQEIEKAIENWSRAVGWNPEHLRAHSRLAIVFERMGRKPQAAREYLHIASMMQHAGELGKAIDAVNRALKIAPDNIEAQQALVMLRDGTLLPKPARPRGDTGPIAQPPEMQIEAPKEIEDSGYDPIREAKRLALSTLAGLFFDQPANGDDETERVEFQNIVSGTGPLFAKNVDQTRIMLHLSQAVDAQLGEDTAQAADELNRAIDAGLDNMAAYFQLAVNRLEARRYESGLRHLQRAVQHPDYALGSRLLLGRAYHDMGRFEDAAVEYLEALKLADSAVVPPDQADGLRQLYDPLIEAQAQEADPNRHKQICESVDDILVRENWRRYLVDFRAQSIPTYEEGGVVPLAEVLTAARSSQVVLAMNSVRQLAREGQTYAATEEAFFALEESPTYLPLHITIGDLLLAQDMIPEAIEKFRVVARSYGSRGEAGRAIDMLRRVVDLSPMDLAAHNQLIDQMINRGTTEEAVQEYLKIAEVHYSLADLKSARKSYTKALRLVQISDLGPEWQIRVLYRIADIDTQSLNWREASRIYEEICAINPGDGKACGSLVDLSFRLGARDQAIGSMDKFLRYMNANNRVLEAARFLEGLLEERPEQAAIHRRIAEEYHLLGNTERAMHHLNQTREILMEAGDRVGAMAAVQRIIELNPPDVEVYQKLLERLRTN